MQSITLLPTTYSLSTLSMCAANGTDIHTYNSTPVDLNFGQPRSFIWPLIEAGTKVGIIGADFLSHVRLLVDVKTKN